MKESSINSARLTTGSRLSACGSTTALSSAITPYSHSSLNKVGLQAWEDDIVQGETVTKLLLAEHNMKLRYFRHPYLDTGRDLQTRRQAEAFLANRGYSIAPVTLDAWDWMYAGVYEDAKKRGDSALQDQLTKSYLSYSDQVFAYTEQLAKQTIGYEPKQILLAARQSTRSRPHWRTARPHAQTGLSLHHAGGRSGRSGLRPARHLCGRGRHGLDRSLGGHSRQASAGRSGLSAMGDRPRQGAAPTPTLAARGKCRWQRVGRARVDSCHQLAAYRRSLARRLAWLHRDKQNA